MLQISVRSIFLFKTYCSNRIYTDISDRLNALCNSKQQYTKKAILNQLLNEALEKYGY